MAAAAFTKSYWQLNIFLETRKTQSLLITKFNDLRSAHQVLDILYLKEALHESQEKYRRKFGPLQVREISNDRNWFNVPLDAGVLSSGLKLSKPRFVPRCSTIFADLTNCSTKENEVSLSFVG